MRNLKYYEDKNKTIIENQIIEDLKKGPVPIAVDCTIEKESDLEKSSVQFAIRRNWRAAGTVEFQKAQFPSTRFMKFQDNTKLNGVPLEDGIIIPFFAPEALEDDEIGLNMIREGLILSLQRNYDEYYHKLLLSFDLSDLPVQILIVLNAELENKLKENQNEE